LKEIYARRFERPVREARLSPPTTTAIFTIVESGSIRYYGGYTTLRFDWVPETGLDAAVRYFESRHYSVYFAGAADELSQFRSRFADSVIVRAMPLLPVSRNADDVVFLRLVAPPPQ
jgi:hypothetical protein